MRIFRGTLRPSAKIIAIAALGIMSAGSLLAPSTAFSLDSDEDPGSEISDRQGDEKSESVEWRSKGIVHLELPLGFRARFDAVATRNLYHSEDLAEAFITGGPQLRYRRSLESRISLSRVLAQNVEFEVAWGARSPIENVDLLNFERQTVGALIRFVHH